MKKLSFVLASLVVSGAFADTGRYTKEEFKDVEVKKEQVLQSREQEKEEEVVVSESVLDKKITINVKGVSLSYFFAVLSDSVGVPIVVREIAYPAAVRGAITTTTAGSTGGQGQATAIQQGVNEYLPISYFSSNKPLKFVLDEITSSLDMWWKYEDGRIVIYRYESRTYQVKLPLIRKQISDKEDAVSISYNRDFMNNIENSLKNLLYDSNSKLSINDSGFVFVYGRKSEIDALEKAIAQLNESFNKQIPLTVRTMLISEEDYISVGINWEGMAGNIKGGLTTATSGIFNISVLNRYLTAKINTLATAGKVKVVEESSFNALNGQPVVYIPASKERIVSKYNLSFMSTVQAGGTGMGAIPTLTVETQDIEVGSKLFVVPYLLEDKRIAVDVYRKESSLDKIEYQTVNLQGFENKVALPKTSSKLNINQTTLSEGESLVLFTNSLTLQEIRNSGLPFIKDVPLLGYLFKEERDNTKKYRLMLLITYASNN